MDEPPSIDPVAAARWAHLPHTESPWLHEEVGRRMADRLSWITLPVQRWVHWEPVRGGLNAREILGQRYQNAECFEVFATDPAPAQQAPRRPWWKRLGGRQAATQTGTSPPEGWAQLVWANMQLHQTADPRGLMVDWLQSLEVDGFLMFSCLGVDTLGELRTLYEELGWPPPAEDFTDMHDWGDQLFRAGFADPVVDMEHITLTFETPARLLQELRGLGRNLHPERYPGLRTPAWRHRLEEEIDTRLRPAPGEPLALTFEIIYGHAMKPQPRATRTGPAPRIEFNLDT